jgi:putative ABC transport system permease protein
MFSLLQDLRFAARVLLRNPGFTVLAVLALALGIGANSAIFSLLDAVTFKPLPFGNPGELVRLWESPPGYAHNAVSPLNFQDWDDQNHSFSAIAGVSGTSLAMAGRDGSAELISGQTVTTAFFDVLGVRPVVGRTFVAADAKPKPDVIVLSESLWRSHFGAAPSIVGQSFESNGRRYTVIGVMPAALQIFFKADFWTPFFIQQGKGGREAHYLQVLGRLKPGVTLDRARADMAVIAQNIARISPSTNRDWGITAESLRQSLISSDLRSTSWVLGGVVGFVLLMACANVANLLLTRGSVRTREFAIRASIGGSRGRILQQLFTEAALLAILGGAAGLMLADLTLSAAPSFLPHGMLPVWLRLSLDGRVTGFAIGATVLTALLFGLAPAWQASRTSLGQLLRSSGRGSTSGATFRTVLAASEIAAAVLLVTGAGLLLRSVRSLGRVDAGFHADDVLTMRVILPLTRYPEPARALQFYQGVERELSATPGVRDVGMGYSLPTDGWQIGQDFFVVGKPKPEVGHEPAAHYQIVNTGYFRTLGIAMVRGRAFSDTDDAGHQPVCIVNEELARRYLAGQDPIGSIVNVEAMDPGGPKPVERVVVGVSHQVKIDGLVEKELPPEIYVPIAQNPWFASSIAVRTAGEPMAMLHAVKTAVARVDSMLPVTEVRTMDQVVDEAVAQPRFRAELVGAFAVLAELLAAVGVFGVLAFSVAQRTREFGIRMALGAQSRDVLRLVLRDALRIVAAGVVAGLAAAAMLTRFLASLLYTVGPRDTATFAATALVLTVTALAACTVPALRAARVDPAVTPRDE